MHWQLTMLIAMLSPHTSKSQESGPVSRICDLRIFVSGLAKIHNENGSVDMETGRCWSSSDSFLSSSIVRVTRPQNFTDLWASSHRSLDRRHLSRFENNGLADLWEAYLSGGYSLKILTSLAIPNADFIILEARVTIFCTVLRNIINASCRCFNNKYWNPSSDSDSSVWWWYERSSGELGRWTAKGMW